MLSLTPFLFGLFACMIDPEADKVQDDETTEETESEDSSGGNQNPNGDSDGDGALTSEDCDDGNPWVSEDCGRTCVGDFEVTGDDDLSKVAGCAIIEGSLDVEEISEPNLAALNHLESILGTLLIMNNSSLETTSGLENLNYIEEDLLISFNDALIDVDGLSSLKYIGGTLSVSNCESLTEISGLNGVQEVGSSMLLNNIPIANLSAFDQLQVLGASLYISDCPQITSLIEISTNLSNFGNNETIGTYDEEGYMIESLFYVYNNEQLCEDVVAQTAYSFESMGWEGKTNSWNNNGSCD